MEDEDLVEQRDNRLKAIKPYQYKKGQSGNPSGRPKGSVSMKTYVKNKLLTMSDEEREEFLQGIDKKTIWEMGEEKAGQGIQVSGELISKVVRLDVE